MKRLSCFVFAASLAMHDAVSAQDFNIGLEAWTKGEYLDALNELKPLAEQGFAPAQVILGNMYANGDGVTQDYSQAKKLLLEAAESNSVHAQGSLGHFFEKGLGGVRDYNQAIYWYEKAAKQEHIGAQKRLGVFYTEGLGVQKDLVQAYKWTEIAAISGNSGAEWNLTLLSSKMSNSDIAEAKRLADHCLKTQFLEC